MADDTGQEDKKEFTPEEIAQKERALGEYYNDSSWHYHRDRAGDRQRDMREASQTQDDAEWDALKDKIGSTYDDLKKQDEADGFFNPNSDTKKGIRARISGMSRQRKGLIAGGTGGIIGLVLMAGGFMGFFNTFKLDFMMGNIDYVAFARVNAVFDRRSDRWMRAYIQTRLREYTGDVVRNADGGIDFKSDRVDTNRPFTDWYRTLRSNGFEQRILNRQGIYFSSTIAPDGSVSYVKIQTPDGVKDIDVRDKSAGAHLRNIDNAVVEVFDGPDRDRLMRRQIKKAVNDNTRFFQVIKRRHIRKDIQNKVGVRDWRFFEKTRNRMADSRAEFKKKMLLKILPQDTKSGKYLICIFGIGDCPSSADPNHPDSRAAAPATGDGLDDNGERDLQDDNGDTTKRASGEAPRDSDKIILEAVSEATDGTGSDAASKAAGEAGEKTLSKFRATLIGKMVGRFGLVLSAINIVDTLDIFHRIHKNITTGKLAEMVVAARGVQAAQAYTTYAIMRDQQKTGDLTAEELGYVMQGLNGIHNSEAYDFFFKSGSGGGATASAMADRDTFCNEEYVRQPNDYYWICDDIKIGGRNGGNTIQEFYDKPAFAVVRKIMEAYDEARSSAIGRIVGGILNAVGGFINNIVNVILEPILDAMGLKDHIEALVLWMSEKFMVALGAGPILTGDFEVDDPGLVMNMIGQGAAYTAEMTMRSAGAAASTAQTSSYSEQLTREYLAEEHDGMSIYDKYFALNNPQSAAASTLFSVVNTSYRQSLANLGQTIIGRFGSLFNIFTGRAAAASNSFGAAELAGLDTYSFPRQCVENDPALALPIDMTNADELNFIPPAEITWDLLNDEQAFWDKVFLNRDRQDEAAQVYNCATLDQRVRGGLGFTSGYNNDDGLEDGPSAGIQNTAVPGVTANGLNGYTIPCEGDPARQKTVGGRSDAIDWSSIPDSGTIGTDSSGNPIKVYIREACSAENVKTIVIASSIHASENYGQPISFELLFKKALPPNMRVIAIPEVNGSRITSSVPRVNANGVNLNRNFNYRWNEMSGDELVRGSTNYRGAAPASEPETQAVVNFLTSLSEVSLLIAYHDNLNYVGVNGNTNHALAVSYQFYVNARGVNLNRRTDYINQKGSLDGWFTEATGKPSMLLEMPAYSNEAQLSTHADAIINLVTAGLL